MQKQNCFEYKINNTETIEQAAEDYANSFEYNDYTIETEAAFKAGVEFAQRWISVDDELPNYYQIVLADNDKYMAIVARVSNGDEEFLSYLRNRLYYVS